MCIPPTQNMPTGGAKAEKKARDEARAFLFRSTQSMGLMFVA